VIQIELDGSSRQKNGYDCGIYVCMFANTYSQELSFNGILSEQDRLFIKNCVINKII